MLGPGGAADQNLPARRRRHYKSRRALQVYCVGYFRATGTFPFRFHVVPTSVSHSHATPVSKHTETEKPIGLLRRNSIIYKPIRRLEDTRERQMRVAQCHYTFTAPNH